MILAGDIGGTNTCLALFELKAGAIVSIAKATFASNNYANLEEIVGTFRQNCSLGSSSLGE
jgi:glucokinase